MKDIQGLRQVPSTEKAEPTPQILQPLSALGILESRLIELGIHVMVHPLLITSLQ